MTEEDPAVTLLRDYLRIKSVHPDPDYHSCVILLKGQAEEMGLKSHVVELVKDKPILIITWTGLEPDLPSILLNSHMDVVPVSEECWKHAPFEAEKEPNGDIFARGIQDMKSVGIQYIEAIRKLMEQGVRLKRTVHLCFVPDEEIGGIDGMGKFVQSPNFKALNVGMALDEGLGTTEEELSVFYAERNPFVVKFHISGNPGHGSLFIENTAAEKVQYMINKMLGYREEQKKLFKEDPNKLLGNFTTVNLTHMSGGVQMNVVPNELCIGFDMRVSPTINIVEFQQMLENWMQEAGGGIRMEFVYKFLNQTMTSVSSDDQWYQAFQRGVQAHKLKVIPHILCAVTDSRYLREVGVPVFGFSPMNHTPVLPHDHDEFLNEKVFLRGIDIYMDIIRELSSV